MTGAIRDSLIRLRAMLAKEFRQMLRDPRMRFFVVVPPLVQLVIFGYAATFDVRQADVAVVDEARILASRELIDAVRSPVSSQIERAGFTLRLDCDAAAGRAVIEVDADAFTQILINLVDNAVKFSAAADSRVIDVGCRQQRDGSVMFSVRDYGPGVPRDQMKKIFRLFYRSESELTRVTVGTGIGLALVRQLAEAMGGRVDMVNREPGAEFRVVFPATGQGGTATEV